MANITKTAICNKALYFLKSETALTDVDTDTTLEANLCNSFFDDALDFVTEQHPWNFAIHRASLAQDGTAPTYGYTYRFQLPTSPYCLKVQEVVDSSDYDVDDWQIVGRYIETDTDSIKITYIKRITALSELSPSFREALAYYLAAQLSEPLTRSSDLTTTMFKLFDHSLKKAKKLDGQQGTYKAETDSDYPVISARFGSYRRADKNYRS